MVERVRQREIGYIAGQHIDAALMAIEVALKNARTIATEPTTTEERYLKLARILDELHTAKDELKSIPR